jgi:hypothetical protein
MEDAFPPRDPANTKNWYGTSLYGWEWVCRLSLIDREAFWQFIFSGCDAISKNVKGWIQEAYTDANKLVNLAGVSHDVDWNSAAALEYLGPSGMSSSSNSMNIEIVADSY